MKYTFRVLPITMAGAGLLLALKVTGLATTGGYTFSAPKVENAAPLAQAPSPATQTHFRPVVTASPYSAAARAADDALITGSTGTPAPAEGTANADTPVVPPSPVTQLPTNPDQAISASERQILEQLKQRREEIEARNRELDVRENLLKAIEIKVEQRVNELKTLEQQLVLSAPVEEAKKQEEEAEKNRLKDLVTMYETMKPKEAARIFDQLDMRVLVNVVMAMNPRKSSEVIAKMSPAAAQKLTVALASQHNPKPAVTALDSLPRIEGRRVQ